MKLLKNIQRGTQAAFSLAELMVVIVIIGLLATLVVPAVVSKLFVASTGVAKSDIVAISNAVTQYMMDNNGVSPDSLEDLILEDQYGNKLLDYDHVPTDPWGNEYQFIPASTTGGNDWMVLSLGADGLADGEGKDQDITNIMIKNKEI